jgi:hypothetical protein
MANRSVQLYLYADLPGIGWRYCRAVFGPNNNLKPHVLLRPDGTEEIQVEADYYLSYRSSGHKMWENVGNNPSGAIRALEKKRTGLTYIAAGGTVLGNENRMPAQKTNLSGAIDEFYERGCQEKNFSLDWKVGVFGLVIQPLLAPGTQSVNRGFDLGLSCVCAQRRAPLEK